MNTCPNCGCKFAETILSENADSTESPDECEHKWELIPIPRWIAQSKGADDLPDFYRCSICGKESES